MNLSAELVSERGEKEGREDPLSVGRELNVSHRLLEVEVMQHGRALEVDKDGSSICSAMALSSVVAPWRAAG